MRAKHTAEYQHKNKNGNKLTQVGQKPAVRQHNKQAI